jgi:hypothetical protein
MGALGLRQGIDRRPPAGSAAGPREPKVYLNLKVSITDIASGAQASNVA